MRTWIVIAAFLVAGSSALGQSKISATVTNFSDSRGVCRACLFNTAESFAGRGQPLSCVQVSIVNQKAEISFGGLAEGSYAISVFHDANNNGRMDKNFLGIPKEGYGASRNELPFAAAPHFDANKIEVKANALIAIAIRLRNL